MYAMKITEDAFKSMTYDSGMWLNKFDLENPKTPADEDIECTTTGDISITCEPEYENIAEDVNNVHGDYKEFQVLKRWNVNASFTALESTPKTIQMSFGAADISEDKKSVTPRNELKQEDFKDRYWVGKTLGGGLVVVHLMNTLSTSGLSFKTSKEGKGNMDVTLTAFSTLTKQGVVPVAFYMISPEELTDDT